MNKGNDFQRIFSQLSHMASLSREGRTKAVIDHLVLNVLVLDSDLKPSSAEQFREAIEVYFGVSLRNEDVQESIDLNYREARLQRTDQIYRLNPTTRADIESRVNEAIQLETTVRDTWIAAIEPTIRTKASGWNSELWACLQKYMASAFQRHGLHTIRLLDPNIEIVDENERGLGSIFREAHQQTCNCVSLAEASAAVDSFFGVSDSLRAKYIAQLLDGTFSFYALSADEAVSEYLRSEIQPLTLFLDTNFIFGVLDLHSNPLNDVSKELLKLVNAQSLPFTFCYHDRTIDEFQRTVAFFSGRLRGQVWRQEISRAAVRNGQLSGIELKYHELNSETPIDPSIFLTRYEQAMNLLADQGFTPYEKESNGTTSGMSELSDMIAEYRAFIEDRYPYKDKSYEAIDHDMRVLLTVRGLQQTTGSILTTGAFFLTADNSLFAYDTAQSQPQRTFGSVILPNQLIQLLRPFIPATDNFNMRFVETFALPEFRVLGVDYTSTRSKVLSYVNTYKDINEETAVRIVANDLLIQHLQNVNDEEYPDYIEKAIVEENKKLQDELAKAQSEATNAQIKATEVSETSLKAIQEERQKRIQAESEAAQVIDSHKQEVTQLQTAYDSEKVRARRLAFTLRLILGLLFATATISMGIILPTYLSWDWMISHPRRIAISTSYVVIMLGLTWVIVDADKNRRKFALGTVVFGVGATVLLSSL